MSKTTLPKSSSANPPKPRSMALSRKKGLPLHIQAEARLRALIAQERFTLGGEFLTDEVTLAQKWGISRNTLRQAINQLVVEGRLRRVAGQGTRVLPAPVRSDIGAWTSFTREMRDRGIVVKNFHTVLEKQIPAADIGADLALAEGGEAWRLTRLRGWEEKPAILAESWLSPRLPLTGTEDFDREPLYDVLQRVARVAPARSVEEIRALPAPAEVAATLGLKAGDPVLLRRRLILDTADRPLEVNLNWCRSDRYALTLESKAMKK